MITAGNFFLHFSFLGCFLALVLSLVGWKTQKPHFFTKAKKAYLAASLLLFLSVIGLASGLLRDQFFVQYVFENSHSSMPRLYKLAALWGGQEGSLLLWTCFLSILSVLAFERSQKKIPTLFPSILGILIFLTIFFLGVNLFLANPFRLFPFEVTEGRGLNPLLQTFFMLIHPPALYLGFVGMALPFAYTLAVLWKGKWNTSDLNEIRTWMLVAWFFLTLGNLLGALWAYEVLGWGGYWGWDPVENASLIPWLTGTAAIHSMMVQEKRNGFGIWTFGLVLVSFLLTLTGTFITRSGVISSVHAFSQSNLGYAFLGLLLLTTFLSVLGLVVRRKELKAQSFSPTLFSREFFFLLSNLVFIGCSLVILWGTFLPLFSDWIQSKKITVGPEYFNTLMAPLGLLLLLLSGIGPLASWQNSRWVSIRKEIRWPLILSFLVGLGVFLFLSAQPYVLLFFFVGTFVLSLLLLRYGKGIRERMKNQEEDFLTAFLHLCFQNPRKYAGYLVHGGVVCLLIGFSGNVFKQELEFPLQQGQTQKLGQYLFQLHSFTPRKDNQREQIFANLAIWKDQHPYSFMSPSRSFWLRQLGQENAQPQTEVAIHRSFQEDIYIALLSFQPETETAWFKVSINPLVAWVWIGGLIILLGTLFIIVRSTFR